VSVVHDEKLETAKLDTNFIGIAAPRAWARRMMLKGAHGSRPSFGAASFRHEGGADGFEDPGEVIYDAWQVFPQGRDRFAPLVGGSVWKWAASIVHMIMAFPAWRPHFSFLERSGGRMS